MNKRIPTLNKLMDKLSFLRGMIRFNLQSKCILTPSVIGIVLLPFLGGCGSGNWTINIEGREKTIVVPSSASAQPSYNSTGAPPPRRYVVRMSDGNLDWEVELPEVATGYELRIPFKNKNQRNLLLEKDGLTSADKDLLSALRRSNPDMEEEGVFDEKGRSLTDPKGTQRQSKTAKKNPSQSAPSRESYLLGLEKARQLFKNKKYELALIKLKQLDEQYPNDVTIKSMIGTLWLQLNQPELAREVWEDALKINPKNASIRQALKQLNGSLNDESQSQSPPKKKKKRVIRRRRVRKPRSR